MIFLKICSLFPTILRSLLAFLLTITFFFNQAQVSVASSRVVNTVVAELHDQDILITARDVQVYLMVGEILGETNSEARIARLDDENFPQLAQKVLNDKVVEVEARSLGLPGIRQSRVEESLQKVFRLGPTWDGWEELAVETYEVSEAIINYFMVEQFQGLKLRAAVGEVTRAEALHHFQLNSERFGELPFEEFEESIKMILQERRKAEKLREWLGILRRKHKARNYLLG